MPDTESSKQHDSFDKSKYDKLIRAPGRGWTPDKYARMAVYVYLYNRVAGRPTKWGLDNNDISFRFRDLIRDRYDDLCKEYHVDSIPGVDFTSPKAKETFLAEMDSYNEHALEIDSKMPNTVQMGHFLEAVALKRREHYDNVRKSVKWQSGEFYDSEKGSDKNGRLIAERLKKVRQIKEQKRVIRRESFWAALKGAGGIASVGFAALGVVACFTPAVLGLGPLFAGSILTRGLIGIVAGVAGIGGVRAFAGGFLKSMGKIFSQRRKLRDLKHKQGGPGDRGLDAIQKEIKLNTQIRDIYNSIDKMGKDGKLPDYKQFVAYVRRHFPYAYNMSKSDVEARVELPSLYSRACYLFSSEKGTMRAVKGFIEHYEVTEHSNEEIPIERDDIYHEMFDKAGKKEDGSYHTMSELRETLIKFKEDASLYDQKGMKREYTVHQNRAAEAVLDTFTNQIFNAPYSNRTSMENVRIAEDPLIQDRLKNNLAGDKTLFINNALRFVQNEEKLYMNTGRALEQDMGVSVRDQLSRESDDIIHGCESLGVDKSSPAYAECESIANDISNMESKAARSAIEAKIASPSIPDSAKRYLNILLERRDQESKVASSDVLNALGVTSPASGSDEEKIYNAIMHIEKTGINGLQMGATIGSKFYSIPEIRNMFYQEVYMDSRTGAPISKENYLAIVEADRTQAQFFTLVPKFSEEQTAKLNQILTEQVRSVQNRYEIEVRGNAVEPFEAGSVRDDITKIMEKIQNIKYPDLCSKEKADEIQAFFVNEISKASPEEVKNYLHMLLNRKVYEAFIARINDANAYKPQEGSAVKEVSSDLFVIQGIRFLDDSYKDQLISAIEPKAKVAFDRDFMEMEKHLLEDLIEGKDEFRKKLEVYRDRPFAEGGFSELFTRKTDDVNAIKNRLETLQLGIELQRSLIASSEGIQNIVDPNTGDTRAVLRVLFKTSETTGTNIRRTRQSPFIKEIMDISNISSTIGLKGLTESGCRDINSTIIAALKNKIDSIKADTYYTDDEKLALILLVKKNALAGFKAQLKKFMIDPNRGHEDEFLRDPATQTKIEGIKGVWSTLITSIDESVKSLKELPTTADACKGLSFSSATMIVNEATSVNKMVNYVNSPYSEPTQMGS